MIILIESLLFFPVFVNRHDYAWTGCEINKWVDVQRKLDYKRLINWTATTTATLKQWWLHCFVSKIRTPEFQNGGFFLACEDFGRRFDYQFPACDFVRFKVEISSCTLIPLFRPGSAHSGSASWDDCDRVFPDELRVISFPDRFPHYAWTAA